MSNELYAQADHRRQLERILVQGIAGRVADTPSSAKEMADAIVTVLDVLTNAAKPSSTASNLDQAAEKFLRWSLPKDFRPDGYITFDAEKAGEAGFHPTGTNLLTHQQAREMLLFVFSKRFA